MRWLSMLRLRLRSLFRRAQVEQELEDELRFHVDQLTARHVERGLSVDDARRTALRTWDGVPLVNQTACGVVTSCSTRAASRNRPACASLATWASEPSGGGGV